MSLGRVCRASGFRPGLVYLSTTSRSFSVNHGRQAKVLTGESMNPFVKQIEYAVRGAIVRRAGEIEKEMAQGKSKPFKEVIKANIGDAHALGMKPLTYPRQVVSLAVNPELFNSSHIAKDAKAKVRRILDSVKGHSLGAYSDSKGLEIVRKDVARYIEKRDGFPANPDDIYLTNGASEGIRSMLKLVQTSQHYGEGRAGVMIPIPQYPLYSATLSELNSYQINYYLDEDNGWKLDINELRRALNEARPHCVPRALCVINPGNPTGQVLSHDNIQEIIQFAKEEGLFIMADEVYQANIYGKGKEFHSFKKVLRELGPEYSGIELASFHSTSKGYMGECGFRGGYMEVTGLDSEVKFHLEKMLSAKLCACLTGQIMMDTVVNPPEPGDESYDVFVKEKSAVLNSFKVRAHLVAETFNAMEGISCNEVMGAMYAFPRIELPRRAIVEAKSRGLHPDSFYAMELLEKTGLCVVPGNGFGQRDSTYHFRITILPQTDKLKTIFESFKVFHQEFMEKYRSDIGKKSAL